MELMTLVRDFARGIERADAKKPRAVSHRSGLRFRHGIGPHGEAETVRLVLDELAQLSPKLYMGYGLNIPYDLGSRERCDLCLPGRSGWSWAIEAKMLRILGDNAKPNDNMLMHILSPYPAHRSALTDCEKLARAKLAPRKAILVFGYNSEGWPLAPVIEVFEALAGSKVALGARRRATFGGLVHPVHRDGAVFAWEVRELA